MCLFVLSLYKQIQLKLLPVFLKFIHVDVDSDKWQTQKQKLEELSQLSTTKQHLQRPNKWQEWQVASGTSSNSSGNVVERAASLTKR